MLNDLNKFVNKGNLAFPNFLYQSYMSLMKSTLDLGTLACSDEKQLRAFKETVKKSFKQKWAEVAEVLQEFDLIRPCSCSDNDYCKICGGSRFLLNEALDYDVLQENAIVESDDLTDEQRNSLVEGLYRAIEIVNELPPWRPGVDGP